jgi:3',5'-cyclic AMP phosphodiesterase CpdA
VLDGLPAGALLDVRLERRDGTAPWSRTVRTLSPPPGPELFRFATMSDLHIGEWCFGYWGTIVEDGAPAEPYSTRAARSALVEMSGWGAELLVIKGDLTESSQPRQWDRFGELLRESGLPTIATPGNHDGIESQEPTGWHSVAARFKTRVVREPIPPHEGLSRLPLTPAGSVQVRDVPGLRIVLVDTTVPRLRTGQLDTVRDEIVDALRDAPGAAWVGLHHQMMQWPFPTYIPEGITRDESVRFLDQAAAANPALLVTSGHTHRHRRRDHGPVVITEVGSPKDYPGTWAGYVVHEGGIRQVVRRIAAPDLLRWTDRSADAGFGLWGKWAPGTLDDRCFTHTWPSR